jgi:hypothetical protein
MLLATKAGFTSTGFALKRKARPRKAVVVGYTPNLK